MSEPYSDYRLDSKAPDLVKDAMEKMRLHEVLTNAPKTYFDSKYLVDLLYANIDNQALSDKEFREMVKNTLPLYRQRTTMDRNFAKIKEAMGRFRLDKKDDSK